MLFDVATVPPAVSSDMDLPRHANVRSCFLNEIELLGFHSDLRRGVIRLPSMNQNRS